MPLDPTAGWQSLSGSEWTIETRSQVDASVGTSLDYVATPDGDLTSAIGQIAADHDSRFQLGVDSLDPRTARKAALDRAVFPLLRRPGTESRYTCRPKTAGTLTAGDVFRDPDGNQWEVLTSAVVGLSTDVVIVAQDIGPTALDGVSATTLTPVTAVVGVVALVYDPALSLPFQVGRSDESDGALRARWAQSQARPNSPTHGGILRTLLSVEWITTATATRVTPGTLNISIVPDAVGADQDEELFAALYDCIGASDDTSGAESVSGTADDGYTLTYDYDVGTTQAVAVVASLQLLATVALADVTTAVQEAIEGVFVGLDPGETLFYADVYCAIVAVGGVTGIASLTLDGGSVDISPASAADVFVFGSATIT